MIGTIKRMVKDKGFGFILGPDAEYFFHRTSVIEPTKWDTLKEGDSVQFDIEKSPKGPRAANVTR
jgi:CspA family cold shock protein